MEQKRINFCDELRGFSALVVMLAHYIWLAPLRGYLYNPPHGSYYPHWFLNAMPNYLDGAVGVAIFFLISGFVIPFSLLKKSKLVFLKKRMQRIYPVMLFCVGLTIIQMLLLHQFRFIFSQFWSAISSVTLLRGWLGGAPINSILWTLEVEISFYLYAAIFMKVMKNRPLVYLAIPACTTFFLLISGSHPHFPTACAFSSLYNLKNMLAYTFGYIVFINIGTILHLHHSKRITTPSAFIYIALSLAVFTFFSTRIYPGNTRVIGMYWLALCIFVYLYKYSPKIKGVFSGFWANISYPLYLCHSYIGYALLSIFMFKLGIHPVISLVTTICIVVIISWLIHIFIEKKRAIYYLAQLFGTE